MNVLQFTEDFFPITSGGAFEDTNVATTAVREGHDITVITFQSDDFPSEETHHGVKIKRPIKPPFFDQDINSPLNMLGRLLAAIGLLLVGAVHLWREDFNVIYSSNHIFHPFAVLLSAVFGKHLISYIAYTPSINPENRESTNPLFLLEQVNFRYFMGDIVYCRNPEIQEEIQNLNPNSEVRLAHGILNKDAIEKVAENIEQEDGTLREWLRQRTDISPNSTIVSFVGRFSNLKRPELAVKVIAELPTEYELVLVGDGSCRQAAEAAVEKQAVEDRVHFLGMVPHKDALRTLIASDHLILTSEVESYPTVVFEALACSCTVAARPIGILPHLDFPNNRLRLTNSENLHDAIKTLPKGDSCTDENILREFKIDTFGTQISEAIVEIVNN